MSSHFLKNILGAVVVVFTVGYGNFALSHTAAGPLDFSGVGASATDLLSVECFNDSNGDADHLIVQVEDLSPAVPGLMVSVQIIKNNKMINTTDTLSSDGNASPEARLQAGNGAYLIAINKTGPGVRNINLTYHCETSSNIHTGTSDLSVFQLQ